MYRSDYLAFILNIQYTYLRKKTGSLLRNIYFELLQPSIKFSEKIGVKKRQK